MTKLSMDPEAVREVARGVERIAEDLRGAQERFVPHAAPAATGKDEVSVTVARTAHTMGEAQRATADATTADLRRLADSLSAHAGTVQRQDSELAAGLRLEA
ncbi:PE domain-containing protein [Tsukamurella sp. 1534]|uniref:PE domain-containing protein n=1 Tax=Tsukamurella sp. 1534 TaxID=1151061 RepID=UPI0002E41A16|nr:PE domain-containing protein [Tsukamurella sp. 1534]